MLSTADTHSVDFRAFCLNRKIKSVFRKSILHYRLSGTSMVAIILLMLAKLILIEGTGLMPNRKDISGVQKLVLARRAAVVDAYRNALIYLNEFNKDEWKIEPYQQINISGKISGARIMRTQHLEDRVIVTISIPINNSKEAR